MSGRSRRRRSSAKKRHQGEASGHAQGAHSTLLEFPGPQAADAEARRSKTDPRPPDPQLSLLHSERVLAQTARILTDHDFATVEEANRFLETLSGSLLLGGPEAIVSDDPVERAQEFAYQAMDAETQEEAEQLARQALKLDPDCVDAMTVLAEFAPTRTKRISKLTQAVKVGERVLGKEFFEENKGYFWGLLETRPYMRARYELATCLLNAGRVREGIEHFEALLDLSENDNLGVRVDLLSFYLMTDQLEAAQDLLDRFEEDGSALFAWARVLVYYLFRDFDRASRAVAAARRSNRHVEKYLMGRKPPPNAPPDLYSLGSEDEAACCAFQIGLAWQLHPMASFWLSQGGRPRDGKYLGALSGLPRRR